MDESAKDKEEPLQLPSCLTVTTKSIKSRSSNCLMDPSITPWLPGLSLTAPLAATNDWNIQIQQDRRPSREEVSSQSNSNFGQWSSQRMSSDKQRLKGSRRKKKTGKKQKKNLLDMERDKDDDQLSPLGRKIIVFVAVFLFLLCILLVGVTLRLGPVIDEMVRKGNEEIYRSMTAGASTSPPLEGAVVVNNTTSTSSTSG